MQVLENIVSLHSQYQNGALVQLVRIRACHARGQGFESPTHRQQTEGKIPGGKEQETRQFTTASFFVSPHRMAVRTGKGKADKGTSTSIREGVRLPEQGGGHAGKKVPKDTYPTVPGKGNNRMLRRIRPAAPENPSTSPAGGGREQHTCREARIRRRHKRIHRTEVVVLRIRDGKQPGILRRIRPATPERENTRRPRRIHP